MNSTREDILKAAIEFFSEKGYDNTSVRDICQLADVNVAAVNYHFKGKKGLGEAVIDHLFENMTKAQNILKEVSSISTDEEWQSIIKTFIYNFIVDRDKEGYRNFYRSRLIFLELNNPSELFGKMLEKYLGPVTKELIKLLRMGLPEDASEEMAMMWLTTLMSQCVMFRKKSKAPMGIADIDFSNPEKVSKVANHIAATIFAGLKFRGRRDFRI